MVHEVHRWLMIRNHPCLFNKHALMVLLLADILSLPICHFLSQLRKIMVTDLMKTTELILKMFLLSVRIGFLRTTKNPQ